MPNFVFSTTANRKRGFFSKKKAYSEIEKKGAQQKKNRLPRKMLRAKNRVLRWGQPASRRLLVKTAIVTQMLIAGARATAQQLISASYYIPRTWYVRRIH